MLERTWISRSSFHVKTLKLLTNNFNVLFLEAMVKQINLPTFRFVGFPRHLNLRSMLQNKNKITINDCQQSQTIKHVLSLLLGVTNHVLIPLRIFEFSQLLPTTGDTLG